MASVSRCKNGTRIIQFVGSDKKRRSIRLGKVTQRVAESIKIRVENLVSSQIAGHAFDDETARWVASLDQVMVGKLASVGLIPKQEVATLAAFIDSYISWRHDTKPRTIELYQQTRRNLIECFGAEKSIRTITPGDADEFRLFLLGKGLAENTVRRRCGRAKQFFTAAVRRRLITSNPFADLKSAVGANHSKFYFVTHDDAKKVLDACPDSQWRVLFALCRYGGLRCPSEVLALRWSDINWETSRIVVSSPKTEHHAGGESRIIPLFPELKPWLEEAYELAESGAEYVISRYRDSNSNLRTQLNRIIRKACLNPWPKPFQNLRSSRETELTEKVPIHVVCAWIGNSQPVAAKHYLQITDQHFEKAIQGAAECGAVALQNAVQQPAATSCLDSQIETQVLENKVDIVIDARLCEVLQNVEAPRPIHAANHTFVELGAWQIRRLRQTPIIEFFPWAAQPIAGCSQTEAKPKIVDAPLAMAQYYQSLLENGVVESRAELARYLGVSRAHVTQVLRKLQNPKLSRD